MLTEAQLTQLAEYHNWQEVRYDNNSILVRSLVGGDYTGNWLPVTWEEFAAATEAEQARDDRNAMNT